MEINWLSLVLAAASSLVVGMIWYNPKVFGNAWMKETGITMNPNEKPNMVKMFGLSLIYAFLMAFIFQPIVIHQFGALGMVGGDADHALPSYTSFMNDYGTAFKTFKHGAFHGFWIGLFLILPSIGISSSYEKRSFKYVLISGGYWVVTCMFMGGIICAMAK
jgi:hypothetical protein